MTTVQDRPASHITGPKTITLNLGPALINVTDDLIKNLMTGSIQAESRYILTHGSGKSSVRTATPADHAIIDEKTNDTAQVIVEKLNGFISELPESTVAKLLSFEALDGRVIAKASSEATLRQALPNLKCDLETANDFDELVFNVRADLPMQQLANLAGTGATR